MFTALMLALAAGAAPALVQTAARTGESAVAPTVDFRSSRWLNDRKVVNPNGEEIAGVSELIMNRGSGKLEYIVIKSGAMLGMGGRSVAIPYASFRWEADGKERFVLAATPEQLKQFPEYSAEKWKAMKASLKDDKSALHQQLAADAGSASDPYAGSLDTTKAARVEGEITKVERVRTSTFGEQVVVTVATTDQSTKRVALGPSWYVNGADAAPMRGDKVVLETLTLPRDPDQLLAATELRSGDRVLRLRGSDGGPAWAVQTVEAGGRSYSTPYSRYLVVSHLPGMKIDCRGSECGKVNDIIIDRHSGEIGFLSVDPNQNFLGVGDTKRLLPWSVATVTFEGTVRIDASKEMVLASPETPSDLSTLNGGTHAADVYKAFDVPAPRFEALKPVSAVTPSAGDAWSAHGTVVSGIEAGSDQTMSGTVTDLTEVRFERGNSLGRAVKMRMGSDEGTEELVLLGPARYLDNQKHSCQIGDAITVDACRTTIDGRRYWIAKSVDCKDSRVVLLDGSNAPAWAQP
jgi:sporulation protein YlmC with PRC-barrel domain